MGSAVALLALLDIGLKWKMSNLRTGGAQGEGDKTSFFEKMHQVQLLTVEKVPQTMVLIGLNWAQCRLQGRELSKGVKAVIVSSVVAAYVFVCRAYDFKVQANGYNMNGKPGDGVLSMYGVVGALGHYISQILLGCSLALQV
ncbi:Hypothetical Protein FCC1311_077442 [Hondaea fermentalgiana]|uniref:Uncharacterized protein n=1 Tax=Hondaea fermentalgiana TaxID=2315210 RepID=A0A2R5GKW4_9STRA|nr:Hypothetical Protein FCC1311_077442 [Hondaea fermentalgiana]|eukprot:GBG31520.1 Hypothetical Protein FCC1311_077442 [Hondaea fermentalgiana]